MPPKGNDMRGKMGASSSNNDNNEDDHMDMRNDNEDNICDEHGNRRSGRILEKEHKWFDNKRVIRNVRRSITSFYNHPYTCWTSVPNEIKDVWWRAFRGLYTWAPENAMDVKNEYMKKAQGRIKDVVYKTKKTVMPPAWMSTDTLEALNTLRQSDEFKKKSERTSIASKKKGLHTQGSVAATVAKRRLRRELNRTPTVTEFFERTHREKGGIGDLLPGKPQKVWADYQKRVQENLAKDPNEQESNDKIFFDALGGWTKNKSIYGLGQAAEEFYEKPTKSQRSNSSNVLALQQRIDQQEATLKEYADQLAQQRLMIEGLQQVFQNLTQGSCSNFPFNIFQPPPPPPPSATV